jgi:hypothetical protein
MISISNLKGYFISFVYGKASGNFLKIWAVIHFLHHAFQIMQSYKGDVKIMGSDYATYI